MPKNNTYRSDLDHICEDSTPALSLEPRLGPRTRTVSNKLPVSPFISARTVERRWGALDDTDAQAHLLDAHSEKHMLEYQKNIEHFVGTVKVPVGIAGPLRVNGLHANGDYLVPLATTEAALVASYNRGSKLITSSGGASVMLINEGVTRTPVFAFYDLHQSSQFVSWVIDNDACFRKIAESTTSHGKLLDINMNMEGNHVYLIFQYETGDASGQNMVTIATNAVFEFILKNSPIKPRQAFLDGNLSGDKKANAMTLTGVRGKKVIAEIHISNQMIEKYLNATAHDMVEFGHMTTTGGSLSGTVGVNAHYANALAGLYIACGQDAACVAESAVGMTRMEVNEQGGLYASVTLPNIMIGTVGGGTALPSQKACLDILGLSGLGQSRKLAEVCAALCLAGELSIVGSFCAGDFSKAHNKLAR